MTPDLDTGAVDVLYAAARRATPGPWKADGDSAVPEAPDAALRDALRVTVEALDTITEMSDATEQSAFREEAWAALEQISDDLRAALRSRP
jgi:hypothetical protein